MQGTAQEGNMSPNGLSAGQTADGLVDNRLEDRGCQVLLGRAFIDQGLNVGFGENAAAGGDGIKRAVSAGIAVQACRISLQKAGHLIDKGTGAAGADAVHPLFDTAVFEVDDLGILSAQFDRDVGLGRDPLKGGGDGDNFLDKRDLKMGRKRQASGTRDDRVHSDVSQLFVGILNKGAKCSLDVCVVSAVVGKHDLTGRVQDSNLDSRGSDIYSQRIVF